VSWSLGAVGDDPGAVAAVLRPLAPDVVCLQEAPQRWRWRQACARIARESGLLVVTGGRSAAGNLLLCAMRVRVVSSRDLMLPQRRGAALALLEVEGRQVSVLAGSPGTAPGAAGSHGPDVVATDGLVVAAPWREMSRTAAAGCHEPIVAELEWVPPVGPG
jgi:hypothetical protein